MYEQQPHIWEVGVSVHPQHSHQENLSRQLQIKPRLCVRRTLFWQVQAFLTAGWDFWLEEHRLVEKHAKCNYLQEAIKPYTYVRKAIHKAFPDQNQRMKAWSSSVQGLTLFHICRLQRCWQVKSMGIYNVPSQQCLSYHSVIAPLLNSQKVMEKYFFPISSAHALQRLNSKESRKENITTFRGLSLWQKFQFLHEKQCHACFHSETSLLRCLLKDARILWEKGLVALSFSLQSVFAFFCLLARIMSCHRFLNKRNIIASSVEQIFSACKWTALSWISWIASYLHNPKILHNFQATALHIMHSLPQWD